ncbi:hypothetical protein C7476_10978 [Phyllobacterium bourgognense]|uniref:Uncharacterized protein n=1 Tax=Phyllobacterium bourgognense TaxID=314236 RepID=A0A368YRJ7_9HYPH|nr:hypothetical protein C7476_10978 [Phyllobacterium bourgognense]
MRTFNIVVKSAIGISHVCIRRLLLGYTLSILMASGISSYERLRLALGVEASHGHQ